MILIDLNNYWGNSSRIYSQLMPAIPPCTIYIGQQDISQLSWAQASLSGSQPSFFSDGYRGSNPSILRTNGSVNVRWSRLIASMVRMGWADNWTRASPRLDKDWKTMEESWDDNWKIDEPSFLYG